MTKSTFMCNYKNAVKEIVRFRDIFNKLDPKVPRKLIGSLGEYYVLRELKKRSFSVELKGGQAGYDVYLPDIGRRIEVRTSLLKNENPYPEGINYFGWRVKNRRQKSAKKFDFMVGVALKDSFRLPKFYIFTHKEAFSVGDVNRGRFRNVQKKIHLFKNIATMNRAIKVMSGYVTPYEIYINKNPKKFLDKWGKIK